MKADKTSDAYGDMMRLKQRDERIDDSKSLITVCSVCISHNIAGYYTTDNKHHHTRNGAIEHQYNILRGIK